MLSLVLSIMNPYSVCVAPPVELSYKLVGSVRRNARAFTEGFLFDEGKLIESAGRYKDQPVVLNSIDPKTGVVKVLRTAPEWDGKIIFGEGLARVGNKFYQLTYDSGVSFVYDAKSWKLLQSIPMVPELKEGWGLSRFGDQLVMSNGTSSLYFLDPVSLKPTRELPVRDAQGQPYGALNMLQTVGTTVYANVFPTDRIVHIDLLTGCVLGQLDLSALWLEFTDEELQGIRTDARANVLNGIAYDPETQLFFVTGKNWPRIFKIRINR